MADPTVTQLAAGTGTTATTTVSFTAQAAGTLLLLGVASDDYRTTSGASRPESTGWTLISDQHTFLGHAVWYKIAAGSETSVQYTIGSASPSAYWCGSATNIDNTTPVDVSNGQFAQSSSNTYTTPTVTTTSGRRIAFGSIGGSNGGTNWTGMGSWTNSYIECGDQVSNPASGTKDIIGVAYLIFDGGGSTSTGATYSPGNAEARTGIIAVFKVASTASNFSLPIQRRPHNGLIMRGRR